jgi:acetylornithine deacetylase
MKVAPASPVAELDVVALTRRLVDIESITYNEGAIGRELVQILAGRSFVVETTPVEQHRESRNNSERFNVYGGKAGETPDVVLSTHMDTVPPFLKSSEDDKFIYGRGACDAKGILAAQIVAAERLREDGVRIGLLFVVGEERDSAGAKVANEHPRGSRFLINGEPTDNRLALASKGTLRVRLTATGKMAHSAYPELGESATHKLIEVLNRLLVLKLPVTEDVGASTLNVGLLEGGHAPNVIADHAEAQVLIRLVGPAEETRAAVLKAAEGLADVDFSLEIPFQRMRKIEGLPTMIAAFTTDIPWLDRWGEPLLLGPGSIHVAHTPDEKLSKRELHEAVDLYVKVAKGLVGAKD